MSSELSRADPELPAIDDRLVAPDSRYEIFDGELIYMPPADPPHATRHVQISVLVEAHAAPQFEVACDMLTRTSRIDDIAPDVSVYPEALDPRTGGRQLEQLAFEVVSTESLGHATRKAAKLAARGVRRVFAIDVERSRALEWSTALGTWRPLDAAEHIDDPAFAVALPVASLIRSARTDDAVARALLAKRNSVLEAARAQDRAEGTAEGLARGRAEDVITVLDTRGVALDSAARERILHERDLATLARWLVRATTCADVAALLDEPAG
jgi:Uma2 family endonuclease